MNSATVAAIVGFAAVLMLFKPGTSRNRAAFWLGTIGALSGLLNLSYDGPYYVGWMISFLLCAMVVLAFLQPNRARAVAAIIFVGVTLAHEFIFGQVIGEDEVIFSDLTDGTIYYISAIYFDLALMHLLRRIRHVTDMAGKLHFVCLVSIYVNAAGWVIWFKGWPPIFYDTVFVGIFAYAVYVLFSGSRIHVGGSDTLDGGITRYPGRRGQSVHKSRSF